MNRIIGALFALVIVTGVVHAADDSVEGELQDITSTPLIFRSQPCSKYFAAIQMEGSDAQWGVAFQFLVRGKPTVALTTVDRMTIEIDETRAVPYVSVELKTRLNYTRLKISQKDLDEAMCLASSPRPK